MLSFGAKGFRRSVHTPLFVRVASIHRHPPKTLLRRPTESSIIDIRTRMVCTGSGFLACPHSGFPLLPTALIDSYLNGPRTLHNERLSYLIVSHTPTLDVQLPTPPMTPRISTEESSAELSARNDRVFNHELLICATHFIGDGMALHQFANDFFGMLGGSFSQEELDQIVVDEWKRRWGQTLPSDVRFTIISLLFYWLKLLVDSGASRKRRGKLGPGAEPLPSGCRHY